MKPSFPRLIAAVTAIIFMATAIPTQGWAQGGAMPAKTPFQEKREKKMKSLGGAMRILKKADSVAPTVDAAKTLVAVAAEFGGLFPKGTGGPATRAKPEIWSNMGDFKMKTEAFGQAAQALLKATASGNLGAVKKAFGGVGQSCRGCHKLYRVPKDRK
jgi:cytochrome c556